MIIIILITTIIITKTIILDIHIAHISTMHGAQGAPTITPALQGSRNSALTAFKKFLPTGTHLTPGREWQM